MTKVWYVALVGRPNTGKSTFLNALIGEKVSIISPRPQTTQRTITGIYTEDETQIIFLDTPGIHESEKLMNEHINSQAYKSLAEADIVIRLLDPTRPHGDEEKKIDELLIWYTGTIIRVQTKKDVPAGYPHKKVDFSVSSITQEWFKELLDHITSLLPEGPFLYDEDYYTDQNMNLRIAEIIREQLFLTLGEEVPYATFVEVTEIEEKENLMKIMAYVTTETDSQKYIVIGKNGAKINEIGTKARLILEDVFDKKIYLALRVKTLKNWRKNTQILERLFPKK